MSVFKKTSLISACYAFHTGSASLWSDIFMGFLLYQLCVRVVPFSEYIFQTCICFFLVLFNSANSTSFSSISIQNFFHIRWDLLFIFRYYEIFFFCWFFFFSWLVILLYGWHGVCSSDVSIVDMESVAVTCWEIFCLSSIQSVCHFASNYNSLLKRIFIDTTRA